MIEKFILIIPTVVKKKKYRGQHHDVILIKRISITGQSNNEDSTISLDYLHLGTRQWKMKRGECVFVCVKKILLCGVYVSCYVRLPGDQVSCEISIRRIRVALGIELDMEISNRFIYNWIRFGCYA